MAHLQWILSSCNQTFWLFTPLHYSTALQFTFEGFAARLSAPIPANEDYKGSICCWYTEVSAEILLMPQMHHLGWMDGAKSPHLFTRGCTPGVGIKLLKTLWIRIFSRRRKSYQETKGFVIWLPFHQHYYELLLQVFASLITEVFTIEKGISTCMSISENIYLNFDLVIKFHIAHTYDMDFRNTLVDSSPPLMLQ